MFFSRMLHFFVLLAASASGTITPSSQCLGKSKDPLINSICRIIAAVQVLDGSLRAIRTDGSNLNSYSLAHHISTVDYEILHARTTVTASVTAPLSGTRLSSVQQKLGSLVTVFSSLQRHCTTRSGGCEGIYAKSLEGDFFWEFDSVISTLDLYRTALTSKVVATKTASVYSQMSNMANYVDDMLAYLA